MLVLPGIYAEIYMITIDRRKSKKNNEHIGSFEAEDLTQTN